MKGKLDGINTNPVYTGKVPSTGKDFEYRGYTSGEEQALLVAKESGDVQMIIKNVKSIIHTCTFSELDPEKLSAFDIEYILLQLRKVSVGEEAEVTLKCQNCEDKVEAVIDLNEIKAPVVVKDHNIINLGPNLHVVMKYPGFGVLEMMTQKEKDSFCIVASLIAQVVNGDDIIETSELNPDEVVRFVRGMQSKTLNKLTDFIGETPTVQHKMHIKCMKCEHNNEYIFKGIHNFFV